MKKLLTVAAVVAVVMSLSLGFSYAQTGWSGMMSGRGYGAAMHQVSRQGYGRQDRGQSYGGWYCPWGGGHGGMMGYAGGMGYGRGMMGPTMGMYYGTGRGYGMNHRGWAMGSGYGMGNGNWAGHQQRR